MVGLNVHYIRLGIYTYSHVGQLACILDMIVRYGGYMLMKVTHDIDNVIYIHSLQLFNRVSFMCDPPPPPSFLSLPLWAIDLVVLIRKNISLLLVSPESPRNTR